MRFWIDGDGATRVVYRVVDERGNPVVLRDDSSGAVLRTGQLRWLGNNILEQTLVAPEPAIKRGRD